MDDSGQQLGRAQQFGTVARTYHQARPPVPEEAVDWLTDGPYQEAVDLGAGTGRFTTQLLTWIPVVHAVEPDLRMLTVLRRVCPSALATPSTAEAIPLPAASVDAVFAAGSWHWFTHDVATAAIARVLRPEGRLGVVWNVRDRSVPWVAELDAIIERHHAPGHEPGVFELPAGAPFSQPEQLSIFWHWDVSPADLILSLGTYSHVLAKPPNQRAMLLARAERYLADHPELVDGDVIHVPIRTVCYRSTLLE